MQGSKTGKGRKPNKGKTPGKVPSRIILAQSFRVLLERMRLHLRVVPIQSLVKGCPQETNFPDTYFHSWHIGRKGSGSVRVALQQRTLEDKILEVKTHQEPVSKKEIQAYEHSFSIICRSDFRIEKVKILLVWICTMESLKGSTMSHSS